MLRRLVIAALFAIAMVSATPPAHASTLSIASLFCNPTTRDSSYSNALNFSCWGSVSGGTGSYTSFVWYMEPTYFPTPDAHFQHICQYGVPRTISLTVTDSAGATALGSTTLYCDYN